MDVRQGPLVFLDTPVWRFVGAVLSWGLFAFSFTGLFQAAAAVMTLGGSCASGGPYAIETECPESVVVFAPLGIFGMFAAAGISLLVARGFGVSLLSWAWPILFVGLGISFFQGAADGQGVVVNILIGLMFVVMGLVPAIFLVRSGLVAASLLGTRGVRGERFAFDVDTKRYVARKLTDTAGDTVPTLGDRALSLVVWAVSAAAGVWLGLLAFAAVAAAG
jgi:hypothetical protein